MLQLILIIIYLTLIIVIYSLLQSETSTITKKGQGNNYLTDFKGHQSCNTVSQLYFIIILYIVNFNSVKCRIALQLLAFMQGPSENHI